MLTRPMRSWMFVPGDKERYLMKAAVSSVDCVFLDLEDGVLPGSKHRARELVANVLRAECQPQRYVRLNGNTTQWYQDDLIAVVPGAPDGVCLPKCEDAAAVLELAANLAVLERAASLEVGATRIVAAIETPGALLKAAEIARAHPRVVGLMLGAEDLALELRFATEREGEAAELVFARSMVVYAAAAAQVESIDGVFPDLQDLEGLERDALKARRMGFTAKSTFNPRQVDVINRVFAASGDEIAYAQNVVKAFEVAEAAGDASTAVDGKLVDRPIVMRAYRLLERAAALNQESAR